MIPAIIIVKVILFFIFINIIKPNDSVAVAREMAKDHPSAGRCPKCKKCVLTIADDGQKICLNCYHVA